MRLRADVIGVSIWGAGLEGWALSRPILAGAEPYVCRPSPAPAPTVLAATERRRTGPVVRLALTIAQEAALASGLPPAGLRSVFGSSNGDGVVVGGILDAMATAAPDERVVSPTAFHNSVHNAAAGYWSIAMGSQQPATCLGCHDWTWAASLLKAMVDVACDREPVLLCCYDHPLPPPLAALRPTVAAFGAGLVLAPSGIGVPLAAIEVRYDPSPPPDDAGLPRNHALHGLMRGNAAARSLRLMETLALGAADEHALPYLDGQLRVGVHP